MFNICDLSCTPRKTPYAKDPKLETPKLETNKNMSMSLIESMSIPHIFWECKI